MSAFNEFFQGLRDIEISAKIIIQQQDQVTDPDARGALAEQAMRARETLEALERLLSINF